MLVGSNPEDYIFYQIIFVYKHFIFSEFYKKNHKKR